MNANSEVLIYFTTFSAVTAPFWVAALFVAYAIGGRQFSLKAIFALVLVEAILIFIAIGSFGFLALRLMDIYLWPRITSPAAA